MTPGRMLALFGSRLDDWALQMDDGRYRRMAQPMTEDVLDRHLAGEITVGAYVLNALGMGIWLCVDLDALDRSWLEALYQAAAGLGVPESALLREFSGSKGYHLWVFFSRPVPGLQIRKLGEVIREKSEVPLTDERFLHPDGRPRQLIEVYPKTVDVDSGKGMGQLVKLPLGIHRKTGRRAEPIDVTQPVQPMAPEMLTAILKPWEKVAFLQQPMPEHSARPGKRYEPYPCTPGLMKAVWGEGGRNVALFNLAKRWNVAGYSHDEVEEKLVPWSQTNTDPALGLREVKSTIRSGMRFTGMGCLDPEIAPFCVGPSCPIYQREHPVLGHLHTSPNGKGPHLKVTSTIPAEYTLPLAAGTVILSAEEILNWEKVRAAQASQVPTAPSILPRRSQRDWDTELDALMVGKEVVVTPEVISPVGVVHGLLIAWCGRASDDPASVERRSVWLDEENGRYVFQGDSFIRFVNNVERGTDRKLVWRIVEEAGGSERKRQIPGEPKPFTVWEVPVK